MLEREDTMREILLETIEDRRESGRTLCGPDGRVRGPLARFPSAVELDSRCPFQTAGAWHTHTHSLRKPIQSLPDVANVVFGNLDASVVVGAAESVGMVAAQDREAMKIEFRDAIGLEVNSPEEVVDALKSRVIRNPSAARHRVRRRLSPLITRIETQFPDVARQVPARLAQPANACPDLELHEAYYSPRGPVMREHKFQAHLRDELRERPRDRKRTVRAVARSRYARMVENVVVSGMAQRILFGR